MTSIDDVVLSLQRCAAPCATMMVGVPGSGKSYIAAELSRQLNTNVLSSDKMREELSGDENDQSVSRQAWELLYERVAKTLRAGSSVIIDGTHNAKIGRQRDVQRYLDNRAASVVAVWVNTPLAVSLRRNRSRTRIVPEDVVRRMQQNLSTDPPSVWDGFSAVYCLR